MGLFSLNVEHFLNAGKGTQCALDALVGTECLSQWSAHGEHKEDEGN